VANILAATAGKQSGVELRQDRSSQFHLARGVPRDVRHVSAGQLQVAKSLRGQVLKLSSCKSQNWRSSRRIEQVDL